MRTDDKSGIHNTEAARSGPAPSPGKQPYNTPMLKVFGSVRLLTGSGTGSGADGGTTPGMTMTSDICCKENIVAVGRHPLGFGLYLFDYRPGFCGHGQGRQFGVLAQEVEQVLPEAVSFNPDGYRRVDYGRLGVFPASRAAVPVAAA